MMAATCMPWTNASLGDADQGRAEIGRAARSATPTAAPSVSRAASAASAGTPAGQRVGDARCGRSAMPMLPRIEIPSAPPSSAPVSEMPDAAPARSGGADPTMSSVVSAEDRARGRAR